MKNEKNKNAAPQSGGKNISIREKLAHWDDSRIANTLDFSLDFHYNLHSKNHPKDCPSKKEFKSNLLTDLREYVNYFQDGDFSDDIRQKRMHKFGAQYGRMIFGVSAKENPYLAEEAPRIKGHPRILIESTKAKVENIFTKKAA